LESVLILRFLKGTAMKIGMLGSGAAAKALAGGLANCLD